MKCLSRFVKLRCPVLLWMYFLLLQLCAVQTVATSLYYMHLTKNNVCYLYLYFFISGSVLLRNCLQCRIWVCVCKELVLLLKRRTVNLFGRGVMHCFQMAH